MALCYGWIDSQVGRLDEFFYRQRFTPRGRRSRWSQINREKATGLIERGLMEPAGLAEVERAREDGRWESAYASPARAHPPEDFVRALAERPEAAEFFATLSSANRYAILFRIEEAKRSQTRARRIAKYVEMLAARQTIHWQGRATRSPSSDPGPRPAPAVSPPTQLPASPRSSC